MAQYSVKRILEYVRIKDILHFFLCIIVFPFAIVAKIFIRDFWLVCEDKNEARDNGYWFFKYVRENKPKQKIAYAINKKSPDYKKVKALGKVVSYGSVSHWFWYIVADKNISSQKGGKPNAAVCYFFEVVLKLRRHNRIFLQHGVTVSDAKWLYYRNCYFDKFICAAKPEYDYIKSRFGYSEKNLALTGFSRFDNLAEVAVDDNLILIMPSWRDWLGGIESAGEEKIAFTDSEYFKKWNSFINSPILSQLLSENGKRAVFYPHRNMQKFVSAFKTDCPQITIADWHDYDVQDLLKRAALLITDYSSVFFDFAYMCKPIIFYQFDEAEFRKKQYQQGYFDYHNTPLGKFVSDETLLLAEVKHEVENGIKRTNAKTIKEIFVYKDNKNSERIYDVIKTK